MTDAANVPATENVPTRDRLLQAALVSFAERGFLGTTTRDIASAAGMSPAAVYVHYRSKEDLLFELSHGGHMDTIAEIDSADDAAQPPAVRLAAVMRAFSERHAMRHTSSRIVNYELHSLAPDHFTEISKLRRTITGRMRAIVDAGIETGDFDVADPQTTTNLLLSMGVDIARWYSDDGPLSPTELGDFYAKTALRVVGAVSPSPPNRPTPEN
ncbi:TetR/AcrR family transcriptional regulator [Gordonia sp. (in: high G+C Gram-positive bacteria)]|uniref:TetR/AcrR family transcriptional regulator n=1 Tax=Gordonia sp. (in: high G+C Gram-positive bacteria) TaxID=84139 RepID=UPI003C74BE97